MNSIGKIFVCTSFGESHGKAMGCILDGVPAGLALSSAYIEEQLKEDIPCLALGTKRKEENSVQILSGVLDDVTLGTPVCIVIPNGDNKSNDYEPHKCMYRPGHGEFTYHKRYGRYTPYGGGRASGRECIARLAAGSVAKKILAQHNITFHSAIESLGGYSCDTPEKEREAIEKCVETFERQRDSTGGVVTLTVKNVPAGVGTPVFGKLHALIAYGIMTIGGVKGVENGIGFSCASMTGSAFNDGFKLENGKIGHRSNRAGGVLAGISNGEDLFFRIAVKPTPTVHRPQQTVNWKENKELEYTFNGRFDANFAPRVMPVAEAMASMIILDEMMMCGLINPSRCV